MVRKTAISRLILLLFLGFVTLSSMGAVSLTCTPFTPSADGNASVEVECFITSDLYLGIKGVQIDLPCQISVTLGSHGPIAVITITAFTGVNPANSF
ncbi:MAG: hypothetical protein AABZ47_03910, partial [Planctomycetota bacterium]